jgi:hypothetical protein
MRYSTCNAFQLAGSEELSTTAREKARMAGSVARSVAVFGRFGEQPLRRLLCRQELSTLDQRADSQHLGFDPGSWSIEAGG